MDLSIEAQALILEKTVSQTNFVTFEGDINLIRRVAIHHPINIRIIDFIQLYLKAHLSYETVL